MKKIVMFDFDGVLVDTLALNLSICEKIGKPVTRERYVSWFEKNIYESVEAKYPDLGRDKGHDPFFEHYVTGLMELSPDPRMLSVITTLACSYYLFIVSSANHSAVDGFLQKHGLRSYFSALLCMEVHKSKTWKIRKIMMDYQKEEDDLIFITDTLGDIEEARRVRVSSLAVSWGYHSLPTLQKAAPLAVVEQPEHLVPLVKNYLG